MTTNWAEAEILTSEIDWPAEDGIKHLAGISLVDETSLAEAIPIRH
jgi:hypothetical protein